MFRLAKLSLSGNGFADFEEGDGSRGSLLDVAVRAALPEDVPAIISVDGLSGRGQGNPSALESAVTDPDRHIVVAESGGSLVGWGKTYYWDYADDPAPAGHYLGGVTVLPAWRRSGIGTALTEVRLEWIWQRSADAWYVVNARNLTSIALHSKWNFVEVARASRFHTTSFIGGAGVLMRARLL
ncbi:GNAT family N-acetyltransferase [Arthrobacter sp. H14]|uniref:GNAT family N-acetyltransferase n=1 Tax=Arthrobacter sp. H14 TaxID=1312959 RepID=UPI0004B7F433|nr:GNAT family N-acetyltransferase [Arthrobacter sp. H14]